MKIADPPDGDDGLSAAERAKAAASWMMFQRPDGTWAVVASLDDERGARMDGAVTARARQIAELRPSGQREVGANERARAAFELLCGVTLGGPGGDEKQPWCRGGGGGAAVGGDTELHNLVPVSTEWHHRIHDGGWTLSMDPDRTLRLYRPDGTLDRVIDPPTPITRHGP